MVVALLVVGALAATRAERALGTTDPGPVVIDEVMGMCVTLVGAPLTWPTALAGFLLFRVFDIVKPPPARQLERAHGGWGIMLDDLAAGRVRLGGALRWRCGWRPAGWRERRRCAAPARAAIVAVGSELLTLGRADTNSPYIGGGVAAGRPGGRVHDRRRRRARRPDRGAQSRTAPGRPRRLHGRTRTDRRRSHARRGGGRRRPADARRRLPCSRPSSERFRRRGLTMPDINRRQALVPDGATVIANAARVSTRVCGFRPAPRAVLLLPGPPREMVPMLERGARRARRARDGAAA